MSAVIQAAFAAALQTAAAAQGVTRVYARVAPSTATAPYVVYAMGGNTGPGGDVYGGSYLEDDVYLVSVVAATQLAAEQLADALGAALHGLALAGAYAVRRENRAPLPPPLPDQTRFVAATYYRVRYTGGG